MKWLLLFIVSFIVSLSANSLHVKTYDKAIQSACFTYWTDFPRWKYYKAQLYQESLLELNAKSPVGAKGLAQFMPSTWLDMQKQMNMPSWATPYMPEYAIRAGAYYMRKLRNAWSSKRPIKEKHYLALASYNAGFGNILKAQKKCQKMGKEYLLWKDVRVCLPFITGTHSQETKNYVERIEKWYQQLLVR